MNFNFTKNIGMLAVGDLAHPHGLGCFYSGHGSLGVVLSLLAIAAGCFHSNGQIVYLTNLSANWLRGW